LGTKFVYKDDVGPYDYLSNGSIVEIVHFLDYVFDRDYRQRYFVKTNVCSLGCDASKDITAYEQLAITQTYFDIITMKTRNFVLGLTRVRSLIFLYYFSFFFLGETANEIVDVVRKQCQSMKISMDSIAFFRTDSAANMAGSKSGAGIQLNRTYSIQHLNCQAHFIMLASTYFMKSSEGKEAERGFFFTLLII
jgi:hypothetical protein